MTSLSSGKNSMLKKLNRSEREEVTDVVYAAMETGNHSAARTVLREFAEKDKDGASMIRQGVLADYGVGL